MTPTIACVIIAHERRRALALGPVLGSALREDFDDVVLVGDWTPATPVTLGYRYVCVAPLTRTTTDALVKRDAGTLATTADILVYLADDHALAPGFGAALRAIADEPWEVIVPNRYTERHGQRIRLNNGEANFYCGGHGGVFRRHVIRALPWSAGPHDRLWDFNMSAVQRALGARFVWRPRADLAILDIEPNAEPWK